MPGYATLAALLEIPLSEVENEIDILVAQLGGDPNERMKLGQIKRGLKALHELPSGFLGESAPLTLQPEDEGASSLVAEALVLLAGYQEEAVTTTRHLLEVLLKDQTSRNGEIQTILDRFLENEARNQDLDLLVDEVGEWLDKSFNDELRSLRKAHNTLPEWAVRRIVQLLDRFGRVSHVFQELRRNHLASKASEIQKLLGNLTAQPPAPKTVPTNPETPAPAPALIIPELYVPPDSSAGFHQYEPLPLPASVDDDEALLDAVTDPRLTSLLRETREANEGRSQKKRQPRHRQDEEE